MTRIFSVLLTIALGLVVVSARPKEDNELVSVAVLFRHGERTIITTYPSDPYNNYSWPVGLGQLTNAGKKHHYELGKWFRQEYGTFLPAKYSEKDIYVRSTNVDRTLMSVESNLAGLYPPTDEEKWDADLLWRPIPVHTVPQTEDDILAMHKDCPKYTKLYQDLLAGQDIAAVIAKYQEVFDICTKESGKECKTLEDIEYLHDALKIENEDFQLEIPEWTKQIYPEKTALISGISFRTHSWTKELARLKNGPFWNYLFTYFRAVIAGDAPKFLMLSGHDTTIANLLQSMEAFDSVPPPYASTLIFELRGTKSPSLTIQYRKDDNDTVLIQPSITFEAFVTKMKDVTVASADWIKECKI